MFILLAFDNSHFRTFRIALKSNKNEKSMMNPTITALITTHERPDYLVESMKSVVEQTVKPDRIIIVDDCSNRDYSGALAQFKDIDFTYIKLRKKKGANHARNTGVKKTNTEIVAFLDDDDVWERNFLESHLDQYKSSRNPNAVVCGFQLLGQEIMKINSSTIVTAKSLKTGNHFCGMSGFSCKRNIILKLNFDESLDNGQDWDFYVRMIQNGFSIYNVPKALFYYRQNTPSGIGTIAKKILVKDADKRLASAYKHRQWLGERNFKHRVADQLLTFLPQKNEKLKWLSKSIKIAGWRITIRTLFAKIIN